MADATAAERQRRYRAHKAGDHSLCAPERGCRRDDVTVTASVTREPVTPSSDLGTRGRRLWRQETDGTDLRPAERVLLEEACRTADRLDQLDRILRGDEDAWMRFRTNVSGDEVTVVVNNVLAEARQQQVALKTLMAELRTSRAEKQAPQKRGKGGQARTSGTGAQPAAVKEGGGVVADLAAWIASKTAG